MIWVAVVTSFDDAFGLHSDERQKVTSLRQRGRMNESDNDHCQSVDQDRPSNDVI